MITIKRSNVFRMIDVATVNELLEFMPTTYSVKSMCLRNVPARHTMYTLDYDEARGRLPDPTNVPIAFAKIGDGYIGDIDCEGGSIWICLAMCGLPIKDVFLQES
ncbi:hypothetical protein B0H67DRAFT_580275 [Lasiosphaeris hirsuta]|uniref:Uncharacterized protein n=1 Tax=Lasiosphaeris hirsuta TaxID=260670 RepID=A0AA40AG72_9PEZI|nr:hypothetical protein B0H67DRAFT_580275 [Lasiosphaeris hirsuta]